MLLLSLAPTSERCHELAQTYVKMQRGQTRNLDEEYVEAWKDITSMQLEVGRLAIYARNEGIEMQNPPQEWNLIKCFTPYNKLSEKLIRRSLMTAEFQQEDAEAKSSIDDLLAMPAMQRMNPGAGGALSRRLNRAQGTGNERLKATNYFRDRTKNTTGSQRDGDSRQQTFRRGFKKIMQRSGPRTAQRERYKKLDDFESHVDRIVAKDL